MNVSGLQYGEFFGNLAYVRWGTGDKKMILFPGGPGNTVPGSFMIPLFYREFNPFMEEYTLYLVPRKKGQPEGYSTRDMSNDYAAMIHHDFGGHVDVIVGTSFGGLIAQHFAADHPQLFDHIVIALAAHKISDFGKAIDTRYAKLLSQGKLREAAASIVDALYPPGITKYFYKAMFWLMASMLVGQMHASFKNDVLVEEQAGANHDAMDSLTRIQVPVLIICGTEDKYFPKEYVEEMASLIQGASLKLYEGKGHVGALEDEAFSKDISEFIGQVRR